MVSKSVRRQGAEVVGLARTKTLPLRSFFEDNSREGEYWRWSSFGANLKEHEIDSVFHLAAQALVETAERGPIDTFETNIRGTWNILEAYEKLPICRTRYPGLQRPSLWQFAHQ